VIIWESHNTSSKTKPAELW